MVRIKRIPDTELLPRDTVFRVGDRVLIHINEFSEDVMEEMLPFDGEWMEIRRIIPAQESCCQLEGDRGGWYWGWYHFCDIRRRPSPQEAFVPPPELPLL